MAGFLHLVAYGATGLAFCFLILSLACGLYYLAELVEEYSVYTKKVIKTMTAVIIAFHILLFIIDRLPFFYLAFSVLCHCIYSLNLKTFPFISLTSVPFISSCVLVFVNHFLWFKYFTTHYRPFMDIAAFFGLCVWLVPFAYFISLSANDNALPVTDRVSGDVLPPQQKQGLMKSLLAYVGIKSQDTGIPTAVNSTDYNSSVGNTYEASSSFSSNTSYGVASGTHYTPPRDIQNRKAA